MAALARRRRRNGQGLLQGRVRAADDEEGSLPDTISQVRAPAPAPAPAIRASPSPLRGI